MDSDGDEFDCDAIDRIIAEHTAASSTTESTAAANTADASSTATASTTGAAAAAATAAAAALRTASATPAPRGELMCDDGRWGVGYFRVGCVT